MTPENAIRWLHHQARTCRDRDSSEAFCLLLPALLRVLDLDAMGDIEAAAFRHEFKLRIHGLPFQDAADRADKFGGAGQGGQGGSMTAIMTTRSPVPAQDMRTASLYEKTQNFPGGRGHAHVAERPALGRPA